MFEKYLFFSGSAGRKGTTLQPATESPNTLTTETIIGLVISTTILIVTVFVISLYYVKRKSVNSSCIEEKSNDLYYSLQVENKIGKQINLPEWLRNRKEIIFPQNSIEKYQELGSGQYGSVYKGKLYAYENAM